MSECKWCGSLKHGSNEVGCVERMSAERAISLRDRLEALEKAALDYQQESNPVGQVGYDAEEALIKLLPNHPRKQEEIT